MKRPEAPPIADWHDPAHESGIAEFRLEGAPNFRDLGGYRSAKGGVVRRGLVFRSGHLSDLTDLDVRKLADLGIRTVVDLRHPYEIELFGHDRLPPEAERWNIPIASAQMDASIRESMRRGEFRSLPDLAEVSREMIRHRTQELSRLLRLLSEPENLPLVFHCIGGKDRTGVASAILLDVLGVPWSVIRRDYLLSNDLLGPTIEDRLSHLTRVVGSEDAASPTDEDLEAVRRFFVLEPHYIDAVREEMIDMAGAAEAYVRDALTLDDETVERLRSHLLGSAEPSLSV